MTTGGPTAAAHILSGTPPAASLLDRLSARAARVERVAGGVLGGLVFLLILLNVTTRFAGMALIWVDEAAVYAMVWMIFACASLSVRERGAVAMTLMTDAMPPRGRLLCRLLADVAMLLFAGALVAMCWWWFDPLGLAGADWNLAAYGEASLNFTYVEPAISLGIRKFWFWLVMPLFATSLTIHCLRNLTLSLRAVAGGGAAEES